MSPIITALLKLAKMRILSYNDPLMMMIYPILIHRRESVNFVYETIEFSNHQRCSNCDTYHEISEL